MQFQQGIATASASTKSFPPFLKWAGGKRWLVANHADLLNKRFNRYIEPFLGGGAVFFHLRPGNAILADANSDLIDCYIALRDQPASVWRALRRHQRNHCHDYYYDERIRRRSALAERAAQFIYLNRTCWNGLYRVNLRGEFNVPIGTKDSVILDTDDFDAISKSLRGVELRSQDFETTISRAEYGDFLFVDPPYTVNHNNNGFLKYNESIFSWGDQQRLRNALDGAKARGTQILLLNANHPSVQKLFDGLGTKVTLRRNSVLSGDPTFRGKTNELAIVVNGRA